MESQLYLRLIIFTAGSLLYLFLAMLLYRRRGRFERLLFALVVALFLLYSGRLLAANLDLHYNLAPPLLTSLIAVLIASLGQYACVPLLVHAHVEYRQTMLGQPWSFWLRVFVAFSYLPLVYLIVGWTQFTRAGLQDLPAIARNLDVTFLWWALVAIVVSISYQLMFSRATSGTARRVHLGLALFFVIWLLLCLPGRLQPFPRELVAPLRHLWPILPGALLAYFAVRHNFLRLGEQRNLVYTVSAGFLALLYLTVALRASSWLEDYLPPVATLSILLFVLVILFEPIQRGVGRWLERSFQKHVERNQRLSAKFQEKARDGDVNRLVEFATARIREEFQLTRCRIMLGDDARADAGLPRPRKFPFRLGSGETGALLVSQERGRLSADTAAALEHLAEQLPPAIDLCRLLEEKVRLERELALRERLALVGQMAASISHNLKNPLSSMKTVLQVQLESPSLPADLRNDCELVVAEIDRLSGKLSQLLQYARPAVRAGDAPRAVDALALARDTVALLRHEAERRQIRLEFSAGVERAEIAGAEDALNDVVSNLVVNAIEAVAPGGGVRVALTRHDAAFLLEVTDDGPGISAENQRRLFQPFFTTKPSGTGLGLAVVEKRLSELGGSIACDSPVANGRGTRFAVTLPAV